MAEGFAFDVFLSHSSKDKPIVKDVADRLKANGLRVWFDEWEIKPGDNIFYKLDEGLEKSHVLVLFMSENAFGSDWATLETNTFRFRDPLNHVRRFIPVRLDDAPIKNSLRQLKYIDWRSGMSEQGYLKLFEACKLNDRECDRQMGNKFESSLEHEDSGRTAKVERPCLSIELRPGPGEYLQKDGNSRLVWVKLHEENFLVMPFQIRNIGKKHIVNIRALYSSPSKSEAFFQLGEKASLLVLGEGMPETFRPHVNISSVIGIDDVKEFPVSLELLYNSYDNDDSNTYKTTLDLVVMKEFTADDRIRYIVKGDPKFTCGKQ